MLIGHHPLLPLPRAIKQIEISQDKTTTIYCNLCLMASHIKQALKGQFRLSMVELPGMKLHSKYSLLLNIGKFDFERLSAVLGNKR